MQENTKRNSPPEDKLLKKLLKKLAPLASNPTLFKALELFASILAFGPSTVVVDTVSVVGTVSVVRSAVVVGSAVVVVLPRKLVVVAGGIVVVILVVAGGVVVVGSSSAANVTVAIEPSVADPKGPLYTPPSTLMEPIAVKGAIHFAVTVACVHGE